MRRPHPIVTALAAIAVVALLPSMVFGEERRSEPTHHPRTSIWASRIESSTSRTTERLMPKLSIPMEALSVDDEATPTSSLGRHVFHDEFSLAVRRDVERTTRRALRNYLLETTGLERRRERARSSRTDGDAGGAARRLRFDFGISHLRPEVGMLYAVGASDIELSLDADGSVDLRFRDRRGQAAFQAGTDGSGRYHLGLYVGF